jgi:hypothetical protein
MMRDLPELPAAKWQRLMQAQLGELAGSAGSPFGNLAKLDLVDSEIIKKLSALEPSDFNKRMAEALEGLNNFGNLHAGEAGLSGVGQVTEAADKIVASGTVAGAATHEITQSALENWWNALPFDTRLLLLMLRWVIAAAATAAIAKGVEAWISSANPKDRQNIYYEITQNVGADAARHLRCVRASMLKIRSEASSGAAVIDSLPRGTAVEIIESAGSWSLIRYKDVKSSDIREGWAASGYLSLEIC